MKKSIMVLIILMLAPAASASLFNDILQKLLPHQQQQPVVEDDFDRFMLQLYQLNTPQAIESLNAEMQNYGVNAVKVSVTDYNKAFYVVKGYGVVRDYSNNDREIMLSKAQIMKMYPYFADGKIDFFERLKLFAIWKMG